MNKPKAIDLSDKNSNQVRIIDRTWVEKRFRLSEQLNQEMQAYSLFRLVSPFRVPVVIDKTDTSLLLEFIPGTTSLKLFQENKLSNAQVSRMAASFVGSVYWNMHFLNSEKLDLFPQLKFTDRINILQNELKANQDPLQRMIGKRLLARFRLYLKELHKEMQSFKKYTFVHRDLHKGNILVGPLANTVIDFEHALIAPIELEVQNSIFWNDQCSLDLTIFREELINNMRVPYSIAWEKRLLTFYVIDQVVIAFRRREYAKIKAIINRYQELKANWKG